MTGRMVATLVAAVATRWWVMAGLAATYCAQSAVDYAGWLDAYGYYLSVATINALFVLIIHLQLPVSRQLRTRPSHLRTVYSGADWRLGHVVFVRATIGL